jgi:tRNA/rRNA methyltransferase
MTFPDPTRFILVGTSHAGNVGAAARAMKVMGFSQLVLVAPRFPDVLVHEETVAMASGAADVLVRAKVVATLDEALEGVSFACATAMTPRDFGPPTAAPRAALPGLAASEHRIGFVFGSERYGLANDDVYRCHLCLSVPTAPGYGSLNLAQAVQILAYEWRQALGGYPVEARTTDPVLADGHAIGGLVDHWREALIHLGHLDPKAPKKLGPRLQQALNRAVLSQEEVHLLRGIARSLLRTPSAAAPARDGPANDAPPMGSRPGDYT